MTRALSAVVVAVLVLVLVAASLPLDDGPLWTAGPATVTGVVVALVGAVAVLLAPRLTGPAALGLAGLGALVTAAGVGLAVLALARTLAPLVGRPALGVSTGTYDSYGGFVATGPVERHPVAATLLVVAAAVVVVAALVGAAAASDRALARTAVPAVVVAVVGAAALASGASWFPWRPGFTAPGPTVWSAGATGATGAGLVLAGAVLLVALARVRPAVPRALPLLPTTVGGALLLAQRLPAVHPPQLRVLLLTPYTDATPELAAVALVLGGAGLVGLAGLAAVGVRRPGTPAAAG